MLIVSGWFAVEPILRDHVVALHGDIVRRARAAPGCRDLAISADPVDAGRINMFELWESDEHLAAWRAIANAPRPITPIVGGEVQKHRISASGPPFD